MSSSPAASFRRVDSAATDRRPRRLSPHRQRLQKVADGNYGVPEHDVVSLREALHRSGRLEDAAEARAGAAEELRRREQQHERRVAAAMARLEESSSASDDNDDDGSEDNKGAASTSRVARRLRKAAEASTVLAGAAAERQAVEDEWTDFNNDDDVRLSREHQRVLLGRRALVSAQDDREITTHETAGAAAATRGRALDYSMEWSLRSPDAQQARSLMRTSPSRRTVEGSRVEHPTAWVSRASGKPPPPPKPRTEPDAAARSGNHQPPFAVVSGVVGFGDGTPVERVDVARNAVASEAASANASSSLRPGSPNARKRAAGTPQSPILAINDLDGAATSDGTAAARFLAWNRRLVQLAGTMQAGAAHREMAECREALDATPPSQFAGGQKERDAVRAVTCCNAGMLLARSHRPVDALEALAEAMAAEETSAGAPAPSTLLNVAAVLFDLQRYREARAIAQSIVDDAAGARRVDEADAPHDGSSGAAADPVMEGEGGGKTNDEGSSPQEQADTRSHDDESVHPAIPEHLAVLARRQVILCDEATRAVSRVQANRKLEKSRLTPAPRGTAASRVRPWRRQAEDRRAASAMPVRHPDDTVATLADVSAISAHHQPPSTHMASSASTADMLGVSSHRRNRRRPTAAHSQRPANVARLLEFSQLTLGSSHPATQVVRRM